MNGQCDTCGRSCDYLDSYCDSCWEEISCEDMPQEYVPTDQDLEDMEVTVTFRSFSAKRDFDLDNPF